jgi:hypothetical protein
MRDQSQLLSYLAFLPGKAEIYIVMHYIEDIVVSVVSMHITDNEMISIELLVFRTSNKEHTI